MLPSIGLPLPEIGLPLGTPEPPKVNKPSDKSKGRGDRKDPPPSRRPPRGGDRRGGHGQSRTVYLVPAYPAYPAYPPPEAPPPAPAPAAPVAEPEPAPVPEPVRPTGTLSLDVETGLPGSAQVYVDDFYVGTVDDVGKELTLEAGPHNVQLRAAGYEPMNINVKIDEGRTITYRGALQPRAGETAPQPPARPAAAALKKPIYAIPGCYLGNVPPTEAALPPNCDPRKAVTIKP